MIYQFLCQIGIFANGSNISVMFLKKALWSSAQGWGLEGQLGSLLTFSYTTSDKLFKCLLPNLSSFQIIMITMS